MQPKMLVEMDDIFLLMQIIYTLFMSSNDCTVVNARGLRHPQVLISSDRMW